MCGVPPPKCRKLIEDDGVWQIKLLLFQHFLTFSWWNMGVLGILVLLWFQDWEKEKSKEVWQSSTSSWWEAVQPWIFNWGSFLPRYKDTVHLFLILTSWEWTVPSSELLRSKYKLGLNWAKLSSSWDWALILFTCIKFMLSKVELKYLRYGQKYDS